MLLINLNPKFLSNGGEGVFNSDGTPAPERKGVGINFDCPCGCGNQCYIPFTNPLDGGPAIDKVTWNREGDTFENMTLTPSIRRIPHNGSCGWHGFIKKGQIETCDDAIAASPEFIERMRKFNEGV